MHPRISVMLSFALACGSVAARAGSDATHLYFGDTHLHTSWSADAYLMGNRSLSPDDAYLFAKGVPRVHPFTGAEVRLETPLDFLTVSDHAEFMGVIPMIFQGDPRVANTEGAKEFLEIAEEKGVVAAFQGLVAQVVANEVDPTFISPEINRSVWHAIADAAERHNAPGQFTTLIGWEWSALPENSNLHRVVIMRDDAETAKRFLPFSSFESTRPEALWAWLDATQKQTGAQFVAIPHNSNLSQGRMFETVDSDGRPIDAEYARTRVRWEPIAEITQVKGDSETHPLLSPEDGFATFEEFLASEATADPSNYIRGALRRGLVLERAAGVNPYAFGVIGSTDSHTALATAEEDNFQQKWAKDGTPQAILAGQGQMNPMTMGASGLAAIWATENTRGALFEALRKREVYGTTGTRLRVRFFGGWDFEGADIAAPDIAATGYEKGVPMGGILPGAGSSSGAPGFLVRAEKDPVGANLDRIQIVKGWLDASGASHERVYDVALADDRVVPATGEPPPVGSSVDLQTARYTNTIGDAELSAWWRDPDFDAEQPAFYYVRVLEIPTPRHTLFDALAVGAAHPADLPSTIQERAYTSAIWYRP